MYRFTGDYFVALVTSAHSCVRCGRPLGLLLLFLRVLEMFLFDMIAPVTGAGRARSGCLEVVGGAVRAAHNACHQRDYLDVSRSGLARLCCLGGEIFGYWSADVLEVVRRAVRARCAGLPRRVRLGTNLRLLRRWFGLLGIATQRAAMHSMLYGAASDQPLDLIEAVVPLAELPEA